MSRSTRKRMTRHISADARSTARQYDREGRSSTAGQEDRARVTPRARATTEENEKTRPKCSSQAGVSLLAALRARQTEKITRFLSGLKLFSLLSLLIYCVCMTACFSFVSCVCLLRPPLRPFTTPSRFVHTLSYHPCTPVLFYSTLCSVNSSVLARCC